MSKPYPLPIRFAFSASYHQVPGAPEERRGFVSGRECELERGDDGAYHCTVVCGELTLAQVVAIRDYMAPVLIDLRLVPRGMSRLGVHVVFRAASGSR